MKSNPFLENLLLMLALLVGLNYLIYSWHKPQRLKLINRLETTKRIETLILGDSTISIGLLGPDFEKAWKEQRDEDCHSFNAGIPDSTATSHYLNLRKAIRHHPAIKRVVYGVIGFRLTDGRFLQREGVIRNAFLEYYQEPEIAAGFHRELRWSGALAFELERRIPMFVERRSFWVRVEKARRRMARSGMRKATEAESPRRQEFVNFLHRDYAEFLARCRRTADSRADLWAPIREMSRLARDSGVELTVVFMPMSQEHQRKFYNTPEWRRYIAHVRRELEGQGVRFIDAIDWVDLPDSVAFPDDIHMTGPAGEIFSRKLAEVIARR
ncbi:MAG: hypothetical protein ACKVJX_13980 [Verrucomicrobiia bacterium]|jgi:hypothetical protein